MINLIFCYIFVFLGYCMIGGVIHDCTDIYTMSNNPDGLTTVLFWPVKFPMYLFLVILEKVGFFKN